MNAGAFDAYTYLAPALEDSGAEMVSSEELLVFRPRFAASLPAT